LEEDAMDGGAGSALRWVREMVGRAPTIGQDWSTQELDRFLSGRNNGGKLLHALFDEVLEEPVPSRLVTIMKDDPTDK
jgi:hypothetical protein